MKRILNIDVNLVTDHLYYNIRTDVTKFGGIILEK